MPKTDPSKPSLAEILEEARCFHQAFRTVTLASVDATGCPHASYAPYAEDDAGRFLIFISELALHTRNLLTDPRVSLLFIEEEHVMKQAFARKRVTYEGLAQEVHRSDPTFETLLDLMAERQGSIVDMLRTLKDFHLFHITPEKAIYVRGFGEAFTLEGPELKGIHWIRDKGHRT